MRAHAIVVSVVMMIAALGASAQEDAWAPTTSGPMASLTAPLTPMGRLTLQPVALFTAPHGAYDASGALLSTSGEGFASGQLFMEAGFLRWLAAGVQAQAFAAPLSATANPRRFGLGDTQVFARAAWRTENEPRHPLATLLFALTLPSGDAAKGFGDGAFIATTGTSFTTFVRPFVFHGDLLVLAPVPNDAGRKVRPALLWTLACEAPVEPLGDHVALLIELTGRHQATTGALDPLLWPHAGAAEQEITLGAGVEAIATDNLQALVGWQRTLFGRNVDAVDTLVLTLVPLL